MRIHAQRFRVEESVIIANPPLGGRWCHNNKRKQLPAKQLTVPRIGQNLFLIPDDITYSREGMPRRYCFADGSLTGDGVKTTYPPKNWLETVT